MRLLRTSQPQSKTVKSNLFIRPTVIKRWGGQPLTKMTTTHFEAIPIGRSFRVNQTWYQKNSEQTAVRQPNSEEQAKIIKAFFAAGRDAKLPDNLCHFECDTIVEIH